MKNEEYWNKLVNERRVLYGTSFDYYRYNCLVNEMEYFYPADCDATIQVCVRVSKEEFLKRNLESFYIK